MLFHPSIQLNLEVCGGLERSTLAEIEWLRRRNCGVELWVNGFSGEHPNVHSIGDRGWRNRFLQWEYYGRFLFAARDFDVLHGHYTPALAVLAPNRTVVHLQGLSVTSIPLYRYLQRRAHRAHFGCNSQHVARSFQALYPSFPAEHVHVVYNAADLNLFHPSARTGESRTTNLCFCSFWKERKGVFELLAAVEVLEARRNDFRLHLAGAAMLDGDRTLEAHNQRRVEEWAQRLATVEIVGPLTHPQLADHLRRMDVGVFPSTCEEPFGNAVVEMMASGLPVVAFDVGGPREIIVHGETGFLVPNKDVHALARALETLIDNPQLRLEMGRKARKRVEQYFTWDRHVDQLLEIYEQIIRDNHDRKRRRERA